MNQLIQVYTKSPKSPGLFYIVAYYIIWIKAWTYSITIKSLIPFWSGLKTDSAALCPYWSLCDGSLGTIKPYLLAKLATAPPLIKSIVLKSYVIKRGSFSVIM